MRPVLGRNRGGWWRRTWSALLLVACGGVVGKPNSGGESHFLRHCQTTCAAGLECISGLCTRACLVGQDSCEDLASDASCTDRSIEPGAVAVCDLECASNRGCSALGEGFICEDGFCRGPALGNDPLPNEPTAGAGGGPAIDEACVAATNAGCDPDEVCATTCEPGLTDDCATECVRVYKPSPCSGPGAVPCPASMMCFPDPRTQDASEPLGLCMEGTVSSVCEVGAPDSCGDGFECLFVPERSGGACVPERVNCWSPWTCEAEPPPCPYGFARSRHGVTGDTASCFGLCVPIDTCGCSSDDQCPENAICDRASGSCAALEWKPPALCSMPFDPGPCDAAMPRFAAVNGVCQGQVYGGCGGNDNNFTTMEECMATCEGRPLVNPCPSDRVAASMCVECGPGCVRSIDGCAERCDTGEDCAAPGASCIDGLCEPVYCPL
jgi:hypothetical protein